MDKEITLLDLFSGIGGFHKGLTEAGFKAKKSYFSEIDKHAIANYKNNFNYAEYLGSVVDVRGGGIERPNIITFGSPCQDFSLAGKRAGMEGQRSSLVTQAIRLISECRPDFFILENVKGTFSSNNGTDFWAIIKAFADIGGYRLEWQLLNTSWFLPQNRERIYLVGHLAEAGRDFKGVFPFRESDFRTNEGSTNSATVRAFTAGGHSGGHHSGMTLVSENEISRTDRSGGRGSLSEKHNWDVICVAQRGRNPENSSDRTTGAPTEQRLEPNSQGTTNTLTGVQKDNYIMINTNTKEGVERAEEGVERAEEGDSINFSNPSSKTRRGRVGKKVAQTIDTQANQAVITDNRFKSRPNREYNQSWTTLINKCGEGLLVNSIRRLTEIEVERLQGFPDNWTEFGNYDGVIKKTPKTQRYKLVGNSVTVDVVKAVAERLLANYYK